MDAGIGAGHEPPASLFDPTTPHGAINFARLVHIAEGIKIELTGRGPTCRALYPGPGQDASPASQLPWRSPSSGLASSGSIKDKVDRTIDCCHEALARARRTSGIRLNDIDYIVLVGGSSRVPLVRDTVREAFCNGDKAEHVKCLRAAAARARPVRRLRGRAAGGHPRQRYLFPLPVGVGQGGIRSGQPGTALDQSRQHP